MMPIDVHDPDFPDVYTDGVSVAAGPFGLTVTFLLSDPDQPREPRAPGRPVGRVRMSRQLAGAMIELLQKSIESAAEPSLTFSRSDGTEEAE